MLISSVILLKFKLIYEPKSSGRSLFFGNSFSLIFFLPLSGTIVPLNIFLFNSCPKLSASKPTNSPCDN